MKNKTFERYALIVAIIRLMKDHAITMEDLREHWFEVDDGLEKT